MIEDTKNGSVSTFAPSKEVLEFTKNVKRDYETGHDILTKTWNELNEYSVLEDMNNGRRMFNAFVDESVESPNDAWKWRGTRSKARNKGIAMHANLTAAYLLPSFEAQNTDSEIDKDISEFMTNLVEWMAQDENSNYKENFLNLVFAMESDPIVYLGAEWNEVMQTIKIKQDDGKYTTKEILDEVLSGFKAPIYTADQILLSNAFERNLQKHKFIGKRRWIEYSEAEAKYGEHENWQYVNAGFNVVYSEDDGLFYEIKDDEHPDLIEEFISMYRREDTEVCFLGGIYMGKENVNDNPIRHRDNFDAPRYNIQQFGFYPIGSHFIFYKSMMNAMRWDNMLYDASTEIVANRAILEAEFPIAISGNKDDGQFDGGIAYPNAVVVMENPEGKVQKLLPDSNLAPLIQSLRETDESLSESSVNETMMGQLPPASQKAYTVSQAQANSKKIIGGVAKGLALSVSRYGLLMGDIAVNNLSIPQVDELSGDNSKFKYRKFLLNDKNIGGRKMSKQLIFDEDMVGAEYTEQEKKEYNLKLLEKTGYPNNDKHIFAANPEVFAKMKYYSKADFNELFPQNDDTMQAMLQGLYSQLQADPMIEREALLRELMYAYFKSKGDKFIAKNPQMNPQMKQEQPNMIGNQILQKQLSTMI